MFQLLHDRYQYVEKEQSEPGEGGKSRSFPPASSFVLTMTCSCAIKAASLSAPTRVLAPSGSRTSAAPSRPRLFARAAPCSGKRHPHFLFFFREFGDDFLFGIVATLHFASVLRIVYIPALPTSRTVPPTSPLPSPVVPFLPFVMFRDLPFSSSFYPY
jgi:hypothetical protein